MQAGGFAEIPAASNVHALAAVAPRSSSLPFHPMGSASSKHPSPEPPPRAFPGAINLKRAFARRKRSDVDRDTDSRSLAGFPHHRVELAPSSASSPAQVLTSSPIYPPSQSRGAKQQLSQLASHVFSPSKKAHQPPLSATQFSQRPLPPPPPPPKSPPEPASLDLSTTDPTPTPTNNISTPLARPHAPPAAAAALAPPSLQPNRSSIIPMSSAIESAVNYMANHDHQQRVVPLPSLPSLPLNPTSPSPVHPPTTSDAQSTPAIPLMQGTTQPQEPHHSALDDESECDEDAVVVARRVERPRARSDSEGVLLDREYSDKRKSDSTISHSTIRPGAGGPRSSRPVSMAESFQSTYTIVPAKGSPNLGAGVMVNKRLSAVDVLEEDDDSFKSLDDPEGSGVDTSNILAKGEEKVSPTSSLVRQKRRSMSLNVGAGASSTPSKVQVGHPPPSTSAMELKHPSYSISEGFYNLPPSTSTSQPTAWAGGRLQPNRNQKLPAIPSHNVNTTFTYPTQRPLPNHPPPPPSFRQTAVSITSSLAPAAGLARKAVERVKGALGHMGSAASHQHHHHGGSGGCGSGSISSASISSTSGYSSSVSVSSAAPSAYPNEWGMLNLARTPSNQSSSATHSSNMHAVNIEEIKKRSERERQQQHLQGKKEKKMKMRRTPNGQSGTYSVASVSTSGSDPDAFMVPSGPVLGVPIRGPIKTRHGSGGIVFKRDLGRCVRETAVWVGRGENKVEVEGAGKELMGRPELKMYERRMLPAVVVRCAQHLLIWGIQEEGLFRVPGRAAHVTKLRSEFDTGMDYDMSGCAPGDLDPHAVASVFKAYLRELPEHILTQKLSQYFDAAIEQESSSASSGAGGAAYSNPTSPVNPGMRKGIGLPSSQKPTPQTPSAFTSIPSSSSPAAFPHPNLRKPPSLSTLAMPSFSGMRPASHNLISALRSLISNLPRENRDLLRTTVELIRATAKESKLTKMPLSNLLMVFLPSLSVGAQLLRVLCEEERIWDGLVDDEPARGEKAEMSDSRRDTAVLDIKQDHQEEKRDGEGDSVTRDGEEESEDEDEEIDAQRRWTVINRPEVPTVYLDSRSQASSASIASSSSALVSSSREEASTEESSVLHDDMSSSDRHSMVRGEEEGDVGMLSSSVESVLTPLTSSAQSSMMHLGLGAMDTVKDLSGKEGIKPRIQVVEPIPAGVETGVVPRGDVVEKGESQPRRPVNSKPLPYISSTPTPPSITPPSITATPSTDKNLPQTPLSPKRRSVPALSFPSLSAFGHRVSHGSSGSEPVSPADSLSSDRAGRNQSGGLRTKKPSLKLLFSKKSTRSLNSLKQEVVHTPGSAPGSAGSQVFALQQQQRHLRVANLGPVNGGEGSGSSDSSVSTPLSAVTAPGTTVGGAWSGSGGKPGSNMVELPPVLDTPIEEGPSLRVELGLDDTSPPGTATPLKQQQNARGKEKKERVKTMVGQTPIADWYGTKSAASSMVDLPIFGSHHDKGNKDVEVVDGDDDDDDDDDDVVKARRRTVMGRVRASSFSSQLSMNHLGLDDNLGGDGDWTKSVLLDLELGFEKKV